MRRTFIETIELNTMPGRAGLIDHRDGDRSNNRWDNLRRATASQNCANRRLPRNNKCGFKGVTRTESRRWRAGIHKNGRRRQLGIFSTPQAAHAVYVAAAHKLFGQFARTEWSESESRWRDLPACWDDPPPRAPR
jgi:hypothetical protein